MIIIEISSNDTIEKSLKKLKRKFDSTKVLRKLRERKEYKKPSEKRREVINKAIYRKNYENE